MTGTIGNFLPHSELLARISSLTAATDIDLSQITTLIETIKSSTKKAEPKDHDAPFFLSTHDHHIVRPIIVDPQGHAHLLLTKTKAGDQVIGEGSTKRVKLSINLSNGTVDVVCAIQEFKQSGQKRTASSWNTHRIACETEIHALKLLYQVPGVIQWRNDQETSDRNGGLKHYLLLEYCEGGDLRNAICNNRLSEKHKQQVMIEIARTVSQIHAKGIIHRDLKTENIFLTVDGHIKIGDFGFAVTPQNRSALKKWCGSAKNFSPQQCLLSCLRKHQPWAQLSDQWASESSEVADRWAVGTIFFELFHPSATPFAITIVKHPKSAYQFYQQLHRLTQEEVEKNLETEHIAQEVRPLIMALLQIAPEERADPAHLFPPLDPKSIAT